jgi:hypothetical protein
LKQSQNWSLTCQLDLAWSLVWSHMNLSSECIQVQALCKLKFSVQIFISHSFKIIAAFDCFSSEQVMSYAGCKQLCLAVLKVWVKEHDHYLIRCVIVLSPARVVELSHGCWSGKFRQFVIKAVVNRSFCAGFVIVLLKQNCQGIYEPGWRLEDQNSGLVPASCPALATYWA